MSALRDTEFRGKVTFDPAPRLSWRPSAYFTMLFDELNHDVYKHP